MLQQQRALWVVFHLEYVVLVCVWVCRSQMWPTAGVVCNHVMGENIDMVKARRGGGGWISSESFSKEKPQ